MGREKTPKTPETATRADGDAFCKHLLTEEKLAWRTVDKRVGQIRTLLYRGVKGELLERCALGHVEVPKPKRLPPSRVAYETKELRRIFSARLYHPGGRRDRKLDVKRWLPALAERLPPGDAAGGGPRRAHRPEGRWGRADLRRVSARIPGRGHGPRRVPGYGASADRVRSRSRKEERSEASGASIGRGNVNLDGRRRVLAVGPVSKSRNRFAGNVGTVKHAREPARCSSLRPTDQIAGKDWGINNLAAVIGDR